MEHYEKEERRCSLPVGLTCDQTSSCVSNAICQKEKPDGDKRMSRSRCVCREGFYMRKNRTCTVSSTLEVGGIHHNRTLEQDADNFETLEQDADNFET
jgi:hypothetical protein